MNQLFRLAACLIVAAAPVFTVNAAVKDLPVKTVNGHLYHYYQIPAKETVYSVCYKLGVTKEELIRYNPSVEDGLKVGMTVYFPYAGDPTVETRTESVTHKVAKGETIFGISHKYGISEKQLMDMNPFLKNGLKAGQTLTISKETRDEVPVPEVAAPVAVSTPADETELQGYLVKKNETLYSIAVGHGITVAELEAANPGLVSLKAGQVINIPVRKKPAEAPKKEDDNAVADNAVTETPVQQTPESVTPEAPADTVAAPAPEVREEIQIAVMLPFMLGEETPSKSSQRYTEFYKGFLLAVDSLRNSSLPIRITTYDTEGSVIKVREILSDPGFRKPSAIIAPDNAAQLAILAEYGKNNGVKVLNSFVVRDESYQTNPQMMQGNLPSQKMYGKAIGALIERLRHSTPVFLSTDGSSKDKGEFVSELKTALQGEGIESVDIFAAGPTLTPDDLSKLKADGNYTFIPLSSRQADLNKLMPAIIEWRDKEVTPMVRLFGYPEWTMFRGETLHNMHNLNTTVYSRFFADYDDNRAESIDGKFRQWYGTPMESVVPRQGLMGFDAGMFLITYLTDGNATHDGVQNGYRFVKASDADNAGLYNDMLYFITFRPGEAVDKTAL